MLNPAYLFLLHHFSISYSFFHLFLLPPSHLFLLPSPYLPPVWSSFSKPLDRPVSGHASSVQDGHIFISGGFNSSYQCQASLYLYHPKKGVSHLANMKQDRALHCMEALGQCLYVVGGVCNLGTFYSDQLSCELYNVATDSWSALPCLSSPRVGAASAVLEERLYILGGSSLEDHKESRVVQRYEPRGQRWENVGSMPGPNNDIRACVIRLPAHLRL